MEAKNATIVMTSNTHRLLYSGFNSLTYGAKIVQTLEMTLQMPYEVATIYTGNNATFPTYAKLKA